MAEGCRLRHDVPPDQVLTYDDVVLPPGRLIDQLRHEQEVYFNPPPGAPTDDLLVSDDFAMASL